MNGEALGPPVRLEDVDKDLWSAIEDALEENEGSTTTSITSTIEGLASLSSTKARLEFRLLRRVFDGGIAAASEPSKYYVAAGLFFDPVEGEEVTILLVIKPVAQDQDRATVKRILSLGLEAPVARELDPTQDPPLHYFRHSANSRTLSKDACCGDTLIVATSRGK